ncbi:unnamed protein product [Rotaria sordida]|uniref:DUF4345 domain-containing protein n=1 Tax=Rotaria sordida TaxID=392033 RepID=A0A813UVH3_9BILA|nr:unnamed protein product [Rotaria sordida]CAF0832904.1 unnamed protein product [Rotaria sordida]CAF0838198.1 unnamed protein product [Rotaria sordida]CAF3627111.1 unnamed protein product [Rotaria sordida]CAF3731153.1 unnamed protein product [Rotaria sordida]
MAKTSQCLVLQIVIGLVAIVPLFFGLNGIIRGPSMLATGYNYPISVDSHFRYLSGLPVAMGILLLRNLPTIDRDASDLHRVSLLIFIGGLGRLWGLITVSFEVSTMVTTLVELLLFPFLCLWQHQVQKNSVRSRTK